MQLLLLIFSKLKIVYYIISMTTMMNEYNAGHRER